MKKRKQIWFHLQIPLNIIVAVWAFVFSHHVANAQEKIQISVELVFAVDTSDSVDSYEYNLIMKGIAGAFKSTEIIDLIGRLDGVAVSLFQWSSQVSDQYVIPWQLLKDPVSILEFAAKVEHAKRDPVRGFTAIGRAIIFGTNLISQNLYEGRLLKIDVSGDGQNNTGISPFIVAREAIASGIVINGLPVLPHLKLCGVGQWHLPIEKRSCTGRDQLQANELVKYYREKVIMGPGAFIEIANQYEDFARAFLRKLLRELTPQVSQKLGTPPAPMKEYYAQLPKEY